MNIAEKMKTTFFTKKFLTFVFCGGMGTLANMLVSTLCSLKINATVAYVCGYFGSSFVTYTLNSRLTFHERLSLQRYVRFVISYIPAVFINILHWNNIIVYGLAALLGLPLTYVIVQVVAFTKRKK